MPPSKMAEWFKDRRWRVVDVSGLGNVPRGDGEGADILVRFDHGTFTVEPPGVFRSPLSGNPGRKGVLLQEVDAEGADIPGAQLPFGEPIVVKARREFGAIV